MTDDEDQTPSEQGQLSLPVANLVSARATRAVGGGILVFALVTGNRFFPRKVFVMAGAGGVTKRTGTESVSRSEQIRAAIELEVPGESGTKVTVTLMREGPLGRFERSVATTEVFVP